MAYLRSSTAGDVIPSEPLTHRNLAINGEMQVWQRATAATTTGTGGGYKTVDRYKFLQNGAARWTSEKHAMSLAELNTTGHATALKLAVTTVDSSMASDEYNYISFPIEAQNLQHLQYGTANAKTLTLSFWVKSNKTGIYAAALRKVDTTPYYYIKEYTIIAGDTWEYKTITITPTAGSTSFITGAAGIIPNDNGRAMEIDFGLSWGDDFHGTDDSWQTAQDYATSNHVNWTDSTSNNFYLTGVQLELGSSATPFEHRSFGDELARCQRYYEKSYDYGTAPGSATDVGSVMFLANRNPGTPHTSIRFKVEKKGSMTVYMYSSATGAVGKLRDVDGGGSDMTATADRLGSSGATVYGGTSTTLGHFIQFHYTAESEL